jgi:hypothetical protein
MTACRLAVCLAAAILLASLVSAQTVSLPVRKHRSLPSISDPAVYERTMRLASSSLRIYSSHPTAAAKRQAGITNFIRVGQITETVGPSATYALLQMNAWTLWMARNPVLLIGGVRFGVQLFVYDDGSFPPDPTNTIVALTEWMITHDKVHMVFTGIQGLNYAVEQTADQFGVPCINTGDYNAGFLPPQNYSLYLLPFLQTVAIPAIIAVSNAGAKTYVEFSDPTGFLQSLYIPTVQAMNGTIKGTFNVTADMRLGGPDRYQPLVDQIKALWPFDVLMGSTTEGVNPEQTNLDFYQCLHANEIYPKYVINWNVGDYPVYRANGTWQVAGQLIDEAYSPAVNASDIVWGSSLKYDADYTAMFGIGSGSNDASLAGAITLLVTALNNSNVNINNGDALLRALTSTNTSSIFGPIYFVNNMAQRTMYTIQSMLPDATRLAVVYPPGPATTALQFSDVLAVPPGWQAANQPGKNWTLTIILATILGTIGLVTIVVLAIVFIWTRIYSVVNIPKSARNSEWGAPDQ